MIPLNIESLTTEYQLLHLVYHRNYNQHRVARWWRWFNELHRRVRRVLKLQYDEQVKSLSARGLKLAAEIKYIVHKVVKKCYWEFNGIIALGQFVPLGLTLLGMLARINSLLLPAVSKLMVLLVTLSKVHKPVKQVDLTEELGEEIDMEIPISVAVSKPVSKSLSRAVSEKSTPVPQLSIDDIFNSKTKKHKVVKAKLKKPKKLKKSDIDDIFG